MQQETAPDAASGEDVAPDVVIVTGMSGAGRTTAIRALEDQGWEAVDNLPLGMLPRLVDPHPGAPLAVGVDTRTRGFSGEALIDAVDALRERRAAVRLVFLDCADDALIRRYAETRRRHPLAPNERVLAGVARERAILARLRDHADLVIETTAMSPHDLKAHVAATLARGAGVGLAISLQSFSYKRGAPREVDMVFDVRFLRNPHWDAALRPLDGRDARVDAFVAEDPLFEAFFARLADMVLLLLPAYKREGKAYLGVGLGCSGGRHRSVAVAERLGRRVAAAGWPASVRHRELEALAGGGSA